MPKLTKWTDEQKMQLVNDFKAQKLNIQQIEKKGINRYTFYMWVRKANENHPSFQANRLPNYNEMMNRNVSKFPASDHSSNKSDPRDAEIIKYKLIAGKLLADVETLKAMLYGKRFQDNILAADVGSLGSISELLKEDLLK